MVTHAPPEGPAYLSIRRAVAIVSETVSDIDEQALRRYIRQGILPAYRLGPRQIRVKREDLDALLQPIPVSAVDGVA